MTNNMEISLAAETLFHIGGFPITNSLLMSWVVMLFLVATSITLRSRLSVVPVGFQNFTEIILEKMLELIDSVTNDRAQSISFFPLVVTIFLFVMLASWIGLLPGLGSIGIWEMHHGETVLVPFIRAGSADLNFTIALAIISVVATQFFGIAGLGVWHYAGKFINFKSPVGFFVGLLETISEIAKMISFSFRLFGNVFAGEVLLLVILFLVPYIFPVPFLVLEVFVGFVQALVFALLTLVFLKVATLEAH